MKHKDYWRKRFEQLEEAQNNKSVKYYLELEKQYKLAINSIEKDILAWYNRFAKNEGISLLEAKKLLNTRELEEFKWSVEEYIKYGKENAINQKWMKELENASARVHITRLEALKLQIQQQVEVLYGNELDGIDKLMRDIYTSGYYHTAFNVQQGVNVGWSLMSLDTNRINKIISKPWATDGLNFSERIWGKYRPTLVNELHTKLTQSIIRGENPKNLVNDFAKRFNVSKSQAKNLIMTESAFFASASRKDCFSDLDVEKYEIIATLDLRTSNICRELDGKIFDMKDYQVGITAPPFHCRCRTTTAPWFEDEEGYRAARGEDGKTYYVPSSMKYNEWYEKYVKNNSKQTGAKYTKGDIEWNIRREEEAELYYDNIRNRKDDISKISKNTNWSEKSIGQIKNHIFYNTHIMRDGTRRMLDSDYSMSVAWQRLINGTYEDIDILLLKHEYLESIFEKKYNISNLEAHRMTEKKHDWYKELIKQKGEFEEDDCLNELIRKE
ncbi:TPA: minor capsid protein [Clostridioides difficile]|uniref:Putative minor head protein n=25 Tax=root TaxID=1 RepID=X5JAI9_9CAUD|nr:minor capsid protein [Clostridioides difficile]YP_009032146.1 head maturation protease [Clostridium phage CDMH1]AXU79065.1 phage minor head protein [Clostridioides difficile]EGT3761268.1 phage head morphogenesis protein [Clostridioides difficile]EGT3769533.1 phage head morphogenesis protein [Clostridioides difficile]EGT4574383.1 phage head morphogenesis protein [Clostridioides difficile]EGT4577879.1 phage head morphogenesis protein [Clostridioides difficile]